MQNFVTVTGRRVDIAPMTGDHEKIVIAGMKSANDSFHVGRRLISQLVSPTLIWEHLTLGEEVDLLYLIRLTSLRNICTFSSKCPSCGKSEDYQVDIRNFRRVLFKCSDDECACHLPELCDYSLDELVQDSNVKNTVNWNSIPEDHLQKNPPKLEFLTEDGSNTVVTQFMLAKYQSEIGAWVQSESIDTVTKSLAKMVTSIDGVTDEKTILTMLGKMTTWDRYGIRDFIAAKDGGVDNGVKTTCKKCGHTSEATVPMTASFFLRKLVRSKG